MTLFRYGAGRWRRLTRGMLLLVAVTAVIAFAMVGAVIALAVLAAGALVHAVVAGVRAAGVSAQMPRANNDKSAVIEGEFVVIERGDKSFRAQH
jgi:uncharacterized protein (DUF58 family)